MAGAARIQEQEVQAAGDVHTGRVSDGVPAVGASAAHDVHLSLFCVGAFLHHRHCDVYQGVGTEEDAADGQESLYPGHHHACGCGCGCCVHESAAGLPGCRVPGARHSALQAA